MPLPTITRRELLPVLAGAPASLSATRGQVRMAVRTDVFSRYRYEEAARRIKQQDFEGVQLGLRFSGYRFDPAYPYWSHARELRQAFREAGLRIVALDGYTSLVAPSTDQRQRNLLALSRLLENCREFGTTVVATHAGPVQRPSEGPSEPEWQLLASGIERLLKVAVQADTVLAVEPSIRHVVGQTEEVQRLLRQFPSRHLQVLWDPAATLDVRRLRNCTRVLKYMAASFGDRIVLAHAQDARPLAGDRLERVPPGQGRMDYATFAPLLGGLGREMFLALDSMNETDVAPAKRFIEKHFKTDTRI